MKNIQKGFTLLELMIVIAILFVLGSLAKGAIAQTIGIAAGQPGSTTHEMISDIGRVCSSPRINIVQSEGSLDNIARISGDKTVQLGYSQEDALIYQQGFDPKMMKLIQMVFPLISAELHLIVSDKSNITSLADLAGKRVIESEEGTGTWVTAQVIKSTTGIQWQALNMSKKDSLKAVQSGQADAAFFVEGRPIGLLANATGIKLIPVIHPALDSFKYYTRVLIPSKTYPWQQSSLNTYKINIGLMSFSFKNQYQKEIGDLVTCIVRNIDELRKTGHPKWRDVDPLDIDRIQWPTHPAAAAAIKRESKQIKR